MSTTPLRVAVLASGSGSNLESILVYLDALGADRALEVVLVASDRADCRALVRGRRWGIPTELIADPDDGDALERMLAAHHVDLVALAGYLKLVPASVTRRWQRAIVNVHPALLPRFGGPGMYGRRVHEAVLASGALESGATVHFVDEDYDSGAVIAQERVPVEPGDSAASLAARVLAVEHRLYPRTLHALALERARARSVDPVRP